MTRVLVTDASVIVDLIGRFKAGPIESLLFADDARLAAPDLLDIEVLQALRRLDRQGQIPTERSSSILDDFRAIRIKRYLHLPLLNDVWQLRHNLTAYDAAYVALADQLDAVLVTRDERLASSLDIKVPIEVP